MEIRDKIVDYIRRNRVSTTEVADCLGKSGLVEGARPVNRGLFKVGPVHWMYAHDESNYSIHDEARYIEPGEIVFISAFNCGDRAMVGGLVTKFMLLYKQAEAVVSTAPMRDANDIIKENYPVWCNGVTPVGTFNKINADPLDPAIEKEYKDKYHGSVFVCDDSGVVMIPKDQLTEEFYKKLEHIEYQEDIWFDCIDRRKWDTYDTVVLKKYLEEDKE